MDDQNRLRLDRIAARHANRAGPARNESAPESEPETGTDAAFLDAFGRVRDDVLRPVMSEVGGQLKAAGYDFSISPGGGEGSPAVDFHIVLPDRGDSKDTIRFFARKDPERGWQVIAELELKRSPFELTRFETTAEITRGVAEQLIVDAVEQMFASTGQSPPSEPPSGPPPAPPALAEPSEPAEEVPTIEAIAAPPASGHTEMVLALGQPSGLALPPVTDAPESRWARWAGPQPVVAETADVDITMFRRRPLPFAAGAPPPAFFATADAARAEERDPRAKATRHQTMVLPAMGAGAPKDEGGERDAVDGGRASLTLEQYAAFCAELAVFTGQTAAIHQRYGVAEENTRKALDDAFAQRFRGDPTLQRRWRALVAHYGDWYRSQGAR